MALALYLMNINIRSMTLYIIALLILSNSNHFCDCDCEEQVTYTIAYETESKPFVREGYKLNGRIGSKRHYYRLLARPIHSSLEESVVIPASEKHTATVIFLHNHGDTGAKWADCLKKNRPPYMKIICPTAEPMEIPLSVLEHSLKLMTAWHNKSHSISIFESPNNTRQAIAKVHQLIENEIKDGIPADRIILGGYFQGAALALQSALTFPQKLAGIMAFNTELPPSFLIRSKHAIRTLHSYGQGDSTRDHNIGEVHNSILNAINGGFEFNCYNGGIYNLAKINGKESMKTFLEKQAAPI